MAVGSRTRSRGTKSEQARQTRVRVVEAATRLFLRDGFLSTTMAQIAKEAGVAVQTLYLSFGSKTAILRAAFDGAIAGDDEPVGVVGRSWFNSVITEPDGPTALRTFIAHGRVTMSRAAPLYAVIQAAAADPEIAEILQQNKRERHAAFTVVAEAVASRPGFAPDLSTDDAAAILYTVLSEDTHLLMVHEHGWTADRWEAWVTSTLVGQFFSGEGGPAATSR